MAQIDDRGPIEISDGSEGWRGGDSLAVAIRPISGFQSKDNPFFPGEPVWFWTCSIVAKNREGTPITVGEVQFPMMGLCSAQMLRIVAGAYCPGAIGWNLYFRSFNRFPSREQIKLGPPPSIDVHLTACAVASQSTASATRAFAWTVGADGIDDKNAPTDYPISDDTASAEWPADAGHFGPNIVIPGPRFVQSHHGCVVGAAPVGPTRYVMNFDAAAVPPNGTAPIDTINLSVEPHWKRKPMQRYYRGFVLAVSTTPNVLTVDVGTNIITTVKQRQRKRVP
jgi:hypothetical protein